MIERLTVTPSPEVEAVLADVGRTVDAGLTALAETEHGSGMVVSVVLLTLMRGLHGTNPDLVAALHEAVDVSWNQFRTEELN